MAEQNIQQVLRLPVLNDQHDPTNDYILVNVSSANESFPLKIEATEGEAPYYTNLTQHEAHRLRDKTKLESKEEWDQTLLSILLRKSPESLGHSNDKESLEAVAILSPKLLSIIIRRKTGEIIQRLGEIPVNRDDDYEIDTVAWAHAAVIRADSLAGNIQSLQSQFQDLQTTVKKLNQQLEDLIEAKSEHETALMTKFCELLNTKKLKIRDQQRLLASVKVDPNQAAKVQAARSGGTTRSPGKSREGKRKLEEPEEDEDEDEDEDAVAAAEVKQDDSEEEQQQRTPDASETEDEDEELGQPGPDGTADIPDRTKAAGDSNKDVDMNDLPPPRALPFGKTAKGGKTTNEPEKPVVQNPEQSALQRQEAGNDDDETTDDDEL